MKKILTLITISFLLFSCSNSVNEGEIKASLIGKTLGEHKITSLSQIKELEILNELISDDIAEYKVKILLEDVKDERKSYVNTLLTYKQNDDKWELIQSNIIKTENDVIGEDISEVEEEEDLTTANFLVRKWEGKLKNKNLILVIEKQTKSKIYGYNVVGNNKRPVSGDWKYQEDENRRNELGEIWTMYLVEGGDGDNDKWDGYFELGVGVYSGMYSAGGTWTHPMTDDVKKVTLEKN